MTDCGCELDCAEIPLSPSGRAHHARALPIGAKRLAVKPQTSGQRLVDLIQYVATHHRATVEAAIKEIHG